MHDTRIRLCRGSCLVPCACKVLDAWSYAYARGLDSGGISRKARFRRQRRLPGPVGRKRASDRLLDALKPDEFELVAGLFRNVVVVPPVAGRQHDPLQARARRGNDLFLDAADRQHQAHAG